MALVVQNLPASFRDIETWVQFLNQEDLLEEGMATHSSILAWKITWTMDGGAWRATPHGVAKSLTRPSDSQTHTKGENPLLYGFSS